MKRYGLSATVAALIVAVSYPSLTVSVEVSYPKTGSSRAERQLGFDVTQAGVVASTQARLAIADVHVPIPEVTQIQSSLEWPLDFADLVLTSETIIVERTLMLDESTTDADAITWGLGKAENDSQATSDTLSAIYIGTSASDSQAEDETLVFDMSVPLSADSQITEDEASVILGFALNLGDSYLGEVDAIIFDVGAQLSDTVDEPADSAALGVGKALADTYSDYTDQIGFHYALEFGIYEPRTPLGGMLMNELALNDSLEDQIQATFDQVISLNVGKNVSDLVGAGSNITDFNVAKVLADTESVAEVVAKDITLTPFSDSQGVSDDPVISLLWDLRIYETFTSTINGAAFNTWSLNQNDVGEGVYSTDELTTFVVGKILSDSQGSAEVFSALLNEFRNLNDIPFNERSLN